MFEILSRDLFIWLMSNIQTGLFTTNKKDKEDINDRDRSNLAALT